MADSPLQTLAAKLAALDLTEEEAKLFHAVMKQAEATGDDDVEGFEAFSLNFTKMAVLSPTRLRAIAGLDGCDDEPTLLCAPPALR